jgi:putative transposase
MRPRRPRRLATFDYIGRQRYFVTMSTFKRQRIFIEPEIVDSLRLKLVRTCELRQFAILAYVFMPDHLHCLFEAKADDCDFRAFVAAMRRQMSILIGDRLGVVLWQDGYYERVLRSEGDVQGVIDYILNNPIRARLVDRAADYRWSWSITNYP